MVTFTPDPEYDWSFSYISVSSGVPDHPVLRAALFRGEGDTPDAGRPTIAMMLITNGVETYQPAQLDEDSEGVQRFAYLALLDGFDVWLLSGPVGRGGSTNNDVSDATFDLDSGLPQQLGDAYVGNGCRHGPTCPMPPGLLVHPWLDPEWLDPRKCLAMFTQWFSQNGADTGADMTKTCLYGNSDGSAVAGFVFWAPNLAPLMFPDGTGQDAVSTKSVWKVAIFGSGQFWYPVFNQALPSPIMGALDTPDVPADTLSEVDIDTQRLNSALLVAQHPDVAALNNARNVLIQYGAVGSGDPPYDVTNESGTENQVHSSWFGSADKTRFPQHFYLATSPAVYQEGFAGRLIDISVFGQDAMYLFELAALKLALKVGGVIGPGWVETIHSTIRSAVQDMVVAPLELAARYDNAPEIAAVTLSDDVYRYGVLYEPPDGMIVQGLGHFPADNLDWLNYVVGENQPAVHCFSVNLGDKTHPFWDDLEVAQAQIVAQLQQVWDRGAIPDLGITLWDEVTEEVIDIEVATTDAYDARILAIAQAVVEFGLPCFVRIWEVNNLVFGGYHVSHLALAWQHVVDMLRDNGVTKAAYVWGIEAGSPGVEDLADLEAWYPGDDYVDWMAVDIFSAEKYLTDGHAIHTRVEAFAAFAANHGKPWCVPEAGAVGADMPLPEIGIPPSTDPEDPDGIDVWEHWFEPFFQMLQDLGCKRFNYVTHDETGGQFDPPWKNALLPPPESSTPTDYLPLTIDVEKLMPSGITAWADTDTVVTCSVPFPDGVLAETGGRPAVDLEGADTWQASILPTGGLWPSGFVKWALIRAVVNPGDTDELTLSAGGTGKSAGSDLVSLFAGTYTLATGPLTATVKTGLFNLLNTVTVDAMEVVTAGSSVGITGTMADGVTAIGVRGNATGTIEENGPASACLRIDGELASAADSHVTVARFSCRFRVSAGSPDIGVTFTIKNDKHHLNASPETDDNKHLQLGWVELVSKIVAGTSKTIVCCNPTTETVQSVGGGGQPADIYCYQKYSTAPTTDVSGSGPAYKPHITKSGSDFTQQGWEKRDDGVLTVDAAVGSWPRHGYLNLSGALGGCTIGLRHMPHFWPASLGANSDGTLRVGVFSRYNPDTFVFPWRMHESREAVFSFHSGAVGTLSATELPLQVARRMDFPLFGRLADYSKYDEALVFPYRLATKAQQDAMYEELGIEDSPGVPHVTAVANESLQILRFRAASTTGGDNNSPAAETRLIDEFLRHGNGGQLYRGLDVATYLAEWAIPRAADFDDADDPEASNDLTLDHTTSTFDDTNNDQHLYDENILAAYYLTGDERLRLALVDEADVLAAATFSVNGNERGNYQWIRSASLVAQFLADSEPAAAATLLAALKDRIEAHSATTVDVDTETSGSGWDSATPGEGARGYYASSTQNISDKLPGENFVARGFVSARLGPIAFKVAQAFLTTSDADGVRAQGRKKDLCKWTRDELLAVASGGSVPAEMEGQKCLIYSYQITLQTPGADEAEHPEGFQHPDFHSVLAAAAEGWRETDDESYLDMGVAHLEAFHASGNVGVLDSGLEVQDFVVAYLGREEEEPEALSGGNAAVATRYVAEMDDDSIWLHNGQFSLLNGFDTAMGAEAPPAEEPEGDAPQLAIHITHEDTDQIATTGQSKAFRRTGELELTFRVPIESGDDTAFTLADSAISAFRGLSLPPVLFGAPRTSSLTTEDGSFAITVTVPWRSDWTEVTQEGAEGSLVTTLNGLTDVLRARFGDTFGPDGLGIPVQYDNVPADPAPDAGSDPWVRFTVLPGSQELVSVSGANGYRQRGLAVASVFVPVDSGEAVALPLVDAVEELFRSVAVDGVVMEAAHLSALGVPTGEPWWQLNVKVPFLIDTTA